MARLIVAGSPCALRILADDLTGALDSAAAFGAGVPVHLGRPPSDPSLALTGGVEVLATATRDVPPTALPALLAPAIGWLAGVGLGGVAFKKVDSLLRGNTFDEVDQVARGGGFDRLLFAPAFPQQHRRTRAGWQWVDSPMAGDVAPRPVGGPSIVEAMQRRGWKVGVERPDDAAPSPEAQPVAWVPDVQVDADLQRLVVQLRTRQRERPAERWLWVGSAGLAQALVAVESAGERAAPDCGVDAEPALAEGLTWLVSASWHSVSRQQWAHLAQVRSAAPSVRGGDLSRVQALLQRIGDGVVPPGGSVLLDLSSAQPLDVEEAAARLAKQVGVLVEAGTRPSTLVVVGGDTLLALCRASGARSLSSAVALDRPGWGSATLQGGRWHGIRCHTRSGAFGNVDDLDRVLQMVAGA